MRTQLCWTPWVLAGVLLGALGAAGQPGAVAVPAALDEWRGWVLHGKGYRRCPFLYDATAEQRQDFLCAWPGRLRLALDADGGAFEQSWTLYDDGPVPLPGDAERWPQDVAVDGQRVPVVSRDGVPSVWLSAGTHGLSGRFAWRTRPATLPLPPAVGLVALTLDGEAVPLPRLDDGLWLGATPRAQAAADALDVRVFRRLEDNVPTRLATQLRLQVAGSVREERLRPVLPPQFVPMTITSDLPARLEGDGALRVQVRPGVWEIGIVARAATVLDRAEMGIPGGNMPGAEIWSYAANPGLRSTLAEGARPEDPARAGSPWPALPTFRLGAGEALTIAERSRGLAYATNDLAAQRDLWLDFDRGGFTFADRIGGTMRVDWRLDMTPPYRLLAATAGDRPLLVTRGAGLDATGVELRAPEVDLEAIGRIDGRGAMPVGGWSSNLAMNATLHLPPGNKLLAALGVDEAPTSWASQWRLLDFFVLLVVAMAAVRLFGRLAGLTALLALALSFHEPGAPVWTWLNLLAAVALAQVAPPGRLLRMARSYRLVSFVVLLLFLVPFGIAQLRLAIYPQLEPAAHREGRTVGLFEMLAGQPMLQPPADRVEVDGPEGIAAALAEQPLVQEMKRQALGTPLALPEDNVPPQAGPGRPDWQWAAHPLRWTGAVPAESAMRLLIAPPWLTGLLRLAAVAALGLFAARFAFDLLGRAWRWPSWRPAGAAASVAGLAVAATLAGGAAHADVPSPALLEALEDRLLEPPACAGACADVVRADVRVNEGELAVTLEVHAAAPVAVPLPGRVAGAGDGADGGAGREAWMPATVTLDGAAVPVRRRGATLWAQVPVGRHLLALEGPLPAGGAVEIPFPATPRTVAAAADAWFVAGIEDGRVPGGALSLTPLAAEDAAPAEADWKTRRLPSFATVERTLRLDANQWSAHTVVRRQAPAAGAIDLAVPLLGGEAIVSGEHTLAAGRVAVSLGQTAESFAWRSSLPRTATLSLTAAVDEPWQEVWRFRVSPAWRVAFAGVPVSHGQAATGSGLVFHPRPGETLELDIVKPAAAVGETLAFDRVALDTVASGRWRHAELTLGYRSTQGASHSIRLPPGAELAAVALDGQAESLPLLEGELNLPISPGAHEVRVAWREQADVGLRVATPVVELGAPAANATTALALPQRWLLFAAGPSLGPAVLYWSELLALIVASLVLGRVEATPLRTRHWLLLGLGFSTFSWLAFAVVAAWLLGYGVRERALRGLSRLWYNAAQIGFGLLALLAFAAILNSIPNGLLGEPDMSIAGYGSSGEQLRWLADRTAGATPEATVWSLPMWVYSALIFLWALWLTWALLRWLPWAWRCFSAGGLWRPKEPVAKGEAEAAAATPEPSAW